MSSSLKVSRSLEFSQDLEPFVELKFPVRGQQLPADHGYGLFAAFVHLIPELRQQQDISILTIPGFGDRQGKILLTQQSCCRIRVPISKISLVYQWRHPGFQTLLLFQKAYRTHLVVISINRRSLESNR